jgi:hypothetical protein
MVNLHLAKFFPDITAQWFSETKKSPADSHEKTANCINKFCFSEEEESYPLASYHPVYRITITVLRARTPRDFNEKFIYLYLDRKYRDVIIKTRRKAFLFQIGKV